jgi:hypothetical protein
MQAKMLNLWRFFVSLLVPEHSYLNIPNPIFPPPSAPFAAEPAGAYPKRPSFVCRYVTLPSSIYLYIVLRLSAAVVHRLFMSFELFPLFQHSFFPANYLSLTPFMTPFTPLELVTLVNNVPEILYPFFFNDSRRHVMVK